MRVARHPFVLFVVGLSLATGCGLPRSVETDLGVATSREGVAPVGQLMSQHDRDGLAKVAGARAGGSIQDGYRVGPDDLLDIRIPRLMDAQAPIAGARVVPAAGAARPAVAEAPVFQQGMRVSAHGDVSLPYLGMVPVAGKSAEQIEHDLERRLRDSGLLRNPQVSVQVAEYRSSVVAVVGSVEKPGLYPITRPATTLADCIWAAGGPTKDSGRVVEFAPGGQSETAKGPTLRIDLDMLLAALTSGPKELNPPARPGDVITIAPAGNVQVDGWVDKPGSYPVTRGLTLTGAIAAAGGQLFPADRSRVAVKRNLGPGEQRVFVVDVDAIKAGAAADFPITDGDVVELPAHMGRLVPYAVYVVAKDMIRIGGNVLLF